MIETWQVKRRHFVAGFVAKDGKVIKAAPIVKSVIGMKTEKALAYLHNIPGTETLRIEAQP